MNFDIANLTKLTSLWQGHDASSLLLPQWQHIAQQRRPHLLEQTQKWQSKAVLLRALLFPMKQDAYSQSDIKNGRLRSI